ncbi:methylmalonyl Co-A mutase-associated GTPase MeaB [Alicyclobacillus cycloheptanicus]|uniref:LAO/AO transport system kinase n=1 Tax=Alicyclobacillus cycloheptanicus TaxID=1457 RepID=A0ABT9XGN4_9BACL|nr:methylmalonyl Co-A mutase-associated GTPase MeaB [Alicyclobacillus cycloheptanicus]MDQ0189459.1 LAO/AO transport system kinase [Alicyclobacillus cycloheptanicus]WDM02326.1 methylmalonyl Co-A mutase-associated GTPase MeaB [Alicyclobacillus cycloheptanicus]
MHPLVQRIFAGDRRAVARALTIIENDGPDKRALLKDLYPSAGRAHVVGFTGAPGAGKSTLVDQVITHLRKAGLSIGVLAVDPSSPFTGGALLGDRVRMTRHSADPGVYIRSMGSRGSMGGLAAASREMLYALEASGCDVILLETVGVGQAELDVMSVADTVALVLTPGAGDHVQAAKAGIMEIADVFVVNKRDLPGADALVRELRLMLHERSMRREDWDPPVVPVSAIEGAGLDDLWAEIGRHAEHLHKHGYWEARRRARHRADTEQLLMARFRRYIAHRAATDPGWREALEGSGGEDPYDAAERLFRELPFDVL